MVSLIVKGENALPKNCRRLVVLGSSKAGKSSIIDRFLHDNFEDVYSPTIENFHRKIYKIRGEAYRLDILDTSGNHPFPAMRRLSYMTGDMFILVYDITCRYSFIEAQQILEQLFQYRQRSDLDTQSVHTPIVLVGSKFDKAKERAVHISEAQIMADNHPFFEVIESSAKENINIDEAFARLFKLANLPEEMCPSLHRKVTPSYCGSNTGNRCLMFRKVSEACGVLQPNARRPSVLTDLHVAKKRGSIALHRKESRDTSRCILQ